MIPLLLQHIATLPCKYLTPIWLVVAYSPFFHHPVYCDESTVKPQPTVLIVVIQNSVLCDM